MSPAHEDQSSTIIASSGAATNNLDTTEDHSPRFLQVCTDGTLPSTETNYLQKSASDGLQHVKRAVAAGKEQQQNQSTASRRPRAVPLDQESTRKSPKFTIPTNSTDPKTTGIVRRVSAPLKTSSFLSRKRLLLSGFNDCSGIRVLHDETSRQKSGQTTARNTDVEELSSAETDSGPPQVKIVHVKSRSWEEKHGSQNEADRKNVEEPEKTESVKNRRESALENASPVAESVEKAVERTKSTLGKAETATGEVANKEKKWRASRTIKLMKRDGTLIGAKDPYSSTLELPSNFKKKPRPIPGAAELKLIDPSRLRRPQHFGLDYGILRSIRDGEEEIFSSLCETCYYKVEDKSRTKEQRHEGDPDTICAGCKKTLEGEKVYLRREFNPFEAPLS